MDYYCKDCGREIERSELEGSTSPVCPECGSYSLRKAEDEEE